MNSTRKKIVAYLAVAAFCVGLVIAALSMEDEPQRGPEPVTVSLGRDVSPQQPTITLDRDNDRDLPEVLDSADPSPQDKGPAIHEDLRDGVSRGAPPGAVDEINDDSRSVNRSRPRLNPKLPLGGAQNYSCPLVRVRNFSSRAAGSRVAIFVLHYTVSRPGSLDAIRGLFDRPSFGASSHFGLEPSGRCQQWVRIPDKAWTQGAFNSVSISVEIIAMGNEPRSWWLAQPIIKNGILSSIAADAMRPRGIPARRVDPVGCSVQNAGWTDHDALECGNNHHDVRPAFPYDVFQRQLAAKMSPVQLIPCTVRNIETALNRRYADLHINVDDTLGDRSREGIRRLDRSLGFPEDGELGPRAGRVLGLRDCVPR